VFNNGRERANHRNTVVHHRIKTLSAKKKDKNKVEKCFASLEFDFSSSAQVCFLNAVTNLLCIVCAGGGGVPQCISTNQKVIGSIGLLLN